MIEHLKSGLSVSTHVGCPMSCDYCVLSVMKEFDRGPVEEQSPDSIVGLLNKESTLFENGKTALFINNRTDPLLPSVLNSTVRLLSLLREDSISSPIVIISKFPAVKALRPYFDDLNLMYIYSYSGYRKDFNYSHLMEDLSTTNNNTPFDSRFHYLRPIIPGINDDVQSLSEIVDTFDNAGFRGSIVAGIRVNKDNVGLLDDGISYDTQHKLLSNEIMTDLRNSIISKGSKYQVYRHTSCGISAFMHEANRLKYVNRSGHCSPSCENYNACSNMPSVEHPTVERVIKRHLPFIKEWSYIDGTLNIFDVVNQEHVAFLKNALGITVTADKICLSASELAITSKSNTNR